MHYNDNYINNYYYYYYNNNNNNYNENYHQDRVVTENSLVRNRQGSKEGVGKLKETE